MLKIQTKPIILEYRLHHVAFTDSTKGIILHVQKVKLTRKVLFLYLYSVVEDIYLYKPVKEVISNNFEEDPIYKGLLRVWFKVKTPFDTFNSYTTRILNVYDHKHPYYSVYNALLIKKIQK